MSPLDRVKIRAANGSNASNLDGKFWWKAAIALVRLVSANGGQKRMGLSILIRRPVVTSIFIVAATMIALGSGLSAAVLAFDINPPNSTGAVTTVLSIMAGTSWFRRKMDRPMSQRERLGFATGVTVLNGAGPIAFLAALVLWFGLPLSVASFDLVLEGGKGTLLEPAFAWLMLFILGAVFAGAYFAAGRNSRKPAKPGKAIN